MANVALRSLALLPLLLGACDLSPDFSLPKLDLGDAFSESPAADAKPGPKAEEGEQAKQPVADAGDPSFKRVDEKAKIEEIAWWRIFHDATLDLLIERAMKDSPTLEVAAQRVAAARAAAGQAEAELFPTVGVGAGPQRQRSSAAPINANLPPSVNVKTKPYTTYTVSANIAYELDLFGRNRATLRAAERDADAEANNFRAARLMLQSDIAQAYFQHSQYLLELKILERTVKTRSRTVALTRSKRDAGAADDLALSQVETDLANARADCETVRQALAANEHALALLLGTTPAQLKLPDKSVIATPPVVPAGIPSALLERRPDIQAAAHTIAAANERIGAARAAYFPNISLSAVGGFTSIELSDLFKNNNKFWSIGPVAGSTILTQSVFDGSLDATLDARKAEYAQAAANYRNSVLGAFRDVEDSLSSLRTLRDQAEARETALAAAKRGDAVGRQRFEAGYSSQLEYLDAERAYLAAQRAQVQVAAARQISTVQLIKALGGSW